MRERLLIVGAGGFGREVLSWALQVPAAQRSWEVVGGFLDDRLGILDAYNLPVGIVASPWEHVFETRDRVVVAIGDPSQRRRFVEIVAARGAQFTTLIHPSVILGLHNTWGLGCIFCPGVIVTTNVRIGAHVIFNCQAGVGHDTVIGSYCTLSGGVEVMGHAVIEDEVLLGSHSWILPHARVSEGAIVGVGSIVLKKVEPHTTVVGAPARQVWKKHNGLDSKS